MKNQISAADAARGLTVLMMPAVHTVMLYGTSAVHSSPLGYVMMFFAEGPGAQLFMVLTGFFIAIGKPKTNRQILSRSVLLLAAGYALNFFRAFLPAVLGLLPSPMLAAYHTNDHQNIYLSLLLTGDILQFAGISYGIVSVIRRSKYRIGIAVLGYFFIAGLAPQVWGIRSANPLVNHLLALLCAEDNRAFFPLFPWLCYPLAGLVMGHFYRQANPKQFFEQINSAGLVLMISGIIILYVTPPQWQLDFYRSSPGKTVSQTGFVCLWLYGMQRLVNRIPDSLFQKLLFFCSRHITLIYFIQWIIIGWGIAIAGYHQLGMTSSLAAIALVNLATFGITLFFSRKSTTAPTTTATSSI